MLLERKVKGNKIFYGYTRRLPYCKPEEVIPFNFISYEEFKLSNDPIRYGIYILKDENGFCSIYDGLDGICHLDSSHEFCDVEVLGYKASRNNFYFKAVNTKGEVGIFHSRLKNDEVVLEVAYPFGKADRIQEISDDIIGLIKFNGNIKNIGYFAHPDFGSVDPIYRTYDSFKINVPLPVLPAHCSLEIIKEHPNSCGGTTIHSISNRITLVEYTKEINGKVVKGIKQLVYSLKDSTIYENKFIFEDLIKPEYSNISFDPVKQTMILEKNENGKKKVGCIFLARNWHLRKTGIALFGGDVSYSPQAFIPCKYSEIKVSNMKDVIKNNKDDTYEYIVRVKSAETSKYGLLKVKVSKVVGDYDFVGRLHEGFGSVSEVVPCMYDEIKRLSNDCYVAKFGDNAVLVTSDVDNKGNFIASPRFVRYKSFTKIKDNSYIGEYASGLKQFLTVLSKEDSGKFLATSKKYKDIKVLDDIILGFEYDGAFDVVYNTGEELKVEFENAQSIEGVASYPKRIFKIKTPGNERERAKTAFVFPTGKELRKIRTFSGEDLEVDYYTSFNGYKIKKNNLYRLEPVNAIKDPIYDLKFDYLDIVTYYDDARIPTSYLIYKEVGLTSDFTLARKSLHETKVLKTGSFQPEDVKIVKDKDMIIVGEVKENHKKYGVISSLDGQEVIPFVHNKISYDKFYEKFIDDEDKVINYKHNFKIKRI